MLPNEMNRKTKEKELLIKNHAIESSINAIAIADLNGIINYANPSFLSCWGYSELNEVTGQFLGEFLELDLNRTDDIVRDLAERKAWIAEFKAKKKDGSLFDVRFSFSLALDENDTPISIVTSFTDITELKKMEQAALLSGKMTEVGQLTTGIAHEINASLTSIIWFAHDCLSQVKPGDPLEHDLQIIETESMRINSLAQKILGFSRNNDERIIAVNVKEEIDKALELIQVRCKLNLIELRKEIDNDIPSIMSWQNQIQQVIINLCNNAIDSMPKRGKLTVKARHYDWNSFVLCHNGQKSEHIEITVSDTGCGISEEIKPRIFEPFMTTKELGKGAGLGLSLVDKIVRNHQGNIEVQSEEGKGTAFIIRFPIPAEKIIPPSDKNLRLIESL